MQVESRYSITAAKADEWIPVNPGTEGVLALGMAHFIIKEGLYDKEFIEKHTFGFEDWQGPIGNRAPGVQELSSSRIIPRVWFQRLPGFPWNPS